jgi:hypothetical protein
VSLITLGLATDYLTEGGLAATAPITISTRPFFWQQMERTRANFADTLNNLANIKHAQVTLTDAQIKALPTTAITLVAAPASGKIIVPMQAFLKMNASAGAYTNINTGAVAGQAEWLLSTNNNDFSAIIYNDTASSNTMLSDFIGTTTPRFIHVYPFFANEESVYGIYTYPLDTSQFVTQALKLKAINTTNGNYTGGNSANSLQADVLYIEI